MIWIREDIDEPVSGLYTGPFTLEDAKSIKRSLESACGPGGDRIYNKLYIIEQGDGYNILEARNG